MTREAMTAGSLDPSAPSVPVLERNGTVPGMPAPARVSPLVPEPPASAFLPLTSAPPVLTEPPESLLREVAPPAPSDAESLALDREQLEELLVDILAAAARGEGVEV